MPSKVSPTEYGNRGVIFYAGEEKIVPVVQEPPAPEIQTVEYIVYKPVAVKKEIAADRYIFPTITFAHGSSEVLESSMQFDEQMAEITSAPMQIQDVAEVLKGAKTDMVLVEGHIDGAERQENPALGLMRAEAVKAETGTELKIKLVDKAAMDRSGAVAQGLSAINTYIGSEQDPADYARMVSNDLMGITRDDLAYDLGRNVDDSVHLFEEWGLPIWKTDAEGVRHDGADSIKEGLPLLKDGGKPVRSGKWQIMINGESYKWIVAEAAKKALGLDRIQERVFIVKLVNDKNDPSRVAGAVGFSVRENKIYVYKAKAILLAAGGCVNLFRPRSVGEGTGRAWYPVWNAGSTYAMAAEAGAELTMMENRFVPARFKDGYGPVGAWFLLFKARAANAYGEDYMTKNKIGRAHV